MKHGFVAIALVVFSSVCLAQIRKKVVVDDQQAQREEWFYSQRAYPLGRIPTGARLKAIAEIDRLDAELRARQPQFLAEEGESTTAAALAVGKWKSIGPRPSNAGSIFVTAGRVNSIAIDPRNSNTLYAGAAEGGVWKTTNGGIAWKPLTDAQPSLANGAVALDPSNPDVVYVGTGEENFAIDSYYGAGILKSINGGASWKNIVGPFLHAYISGLAVHPTNGQILLCSSDTGIWRSSDGAATWSEVLKGTGTAVLFDPTDGNIAYAALGSPFGAFNNGAYRSTDGGETWQGIRGSGANALPSTNVGRISLAIAPSSPATLYAAVHDYSTGSLLDIFKTTNSGSIWNRTHAPDICSATGQCWYDMTIRVSPTDSNVVFAGGQTEIIRTINGGATWASPYFIGPNQEQAIHSDYHDLQFAHDGRTLYIANDGGVYSTTDITSPGVNWTELNDTFAITQFYPGIAIHPTNLGIALAGTQDNGLQRYSGNLSWDYVNCGDGGFSAIDRVVGSVAYTVCVAREIIIDRTSDGGDNWISSEFGIDQRDRAQFVAPMVIDPSNSRTLYYGTYRIWQTRDGAGKWSPISPDLTGGGPQTIQAIVVAPGDPNVVYAGTSDGKVQVTYNALAGPNASWIDRSAGLAPKTLTSITVDPVDAGTAYVTYTGFLRAVKAPTLHVFKTTDGGAKWTDISGNLPDLPVNSLAVDPDLPNTLYIGTDAGVQVTTDGGTIWSTLGSGLPRVVVEALVLHRPTRTLRAATHGRGVWDVLIPLSSTSASQNPTISSLSPNAMDAGKPGFSIAVTGSNFAAGSKLRWDGVSRTTHVVDNKHLTAQISAGDIANVGTVEIDVFSPSTGGGASNALRFTIGPAPLALAAVSAANSQTGLAPGSIAALYGTNLVGVTALADSAPPLPFTLGGTTLNIPGSPVALFFVSPLQINFQVPFIPVSGSTQTTLTVSQGELSTTLGITLVPYAPALFTTNSQGTGQAAALIGTSSALAAPSGAFAGSRPVKKGETLAVFCTGLGNVTNAPDTGAPSPSNPLAHTRATPTVSLSGQSVTPSFSGLAPGFVGLYQVNLQIPGSAPSGSAIPMSLTIGGVTSNTATIAVQ